MNNPWIRFSLFGFLMCATFMFTLPSYAHGDERHDCCETVGEEEQTEASTTVEREGTMLPDVMMEPGSNELQSLPQSTPKTMNTVPPGLGEILLGLIFVIPVSLYTYKYNR